LKRNLSAKQSFHVPPKSTKFQQNLYEKLA
jgi:hypothetical protein